MVAFTMDDSKLTSDKARESTVGRMDPCTVASFTVDYGTVTERIPLPTDRSTMVRGKMASSTALANVSGKMVGAIVENGKTEKHTDTAWKCERMVPLGTMDFGSTIVP